MAQRVQDTGRERTFGTIAILDCDPELAEDLSEAQLALARRQVLAEAISYPAGPWAVGPDDFEGAGSLGLLVLEGLLAREVTVGDFTGAELLGPGDVIQPWLRIGPEQSVAVCGLRRVDDRLLSVLWHFADRWGTVTPDGVRLDVRLTHETLAAVTGARRPSVSTALKRLVDEGRLHSLPRSRWLLLGHPPAELKTVHARARGVEERK